jgi:hypothetical protein
MKKLIALFVILAAGMVSAQTENYGAWKDTTGIVGLVSDSLKYGSVMKLSPYDQTAFIVAANDTDAAGFANDSINFSWGYRLGWTTMNANGKLDTVWKYRVIVDTFDITTAGNRIVFGTTSTTTDMTTGKEVYLPKKIDTLNVTGMAVQATPITPIWAPLIQPWAKGLTGNNLGSPVKIFVTIQHRLYQPVRNQ